ncbi:MAG: hypothetical protein H6662_14525 [Ardenticatenaceae bacterium]|nr:hypothetical protein [Anaerolineales bacterium]MCB8922800.1 hypothetical protein [Ardenticatenaceae bacterium]MCB8991933.1 hypothetical protein [Ardenticatenaceae bacterium]MCB9004743.1 hypothetical protein [Ardenticatenaceae bacterium]
MSSRIRFIFWLVLLVGTAVILFFVFRRETQAEFGPAVALCPGPDQYGYTCEPGNNYAYLDATTNTALYSDDGVTAVALPFPFIFYGTTYTTLQASSNGTLQLGNAGYPEYGNQCLDNGPIDYMGDMIAPFWDDLDLSFAGYLETAVVGDAPNRIFVIEWDGVPRYGGDFTDTLTFEVQLFEASNDIVFLYQDVSVLEGNRGGSATVGLQSAAQGLTLQLGCNQPVLGDGTGIAFPHPVEPNEEVGMETAVPPTIPATLAVKGVVNDVIMGLSQQESDVLAMLQSDWLLQNPPLRFSWHGLDLTGNGRDDLLLLWHGPNADPYLTQVAVLAANADQSYTSLLDVPLSTRTDPVHHISLAETVDLTGDGVADALLRDEQSGQLFAITTAPGSLSLLPVPGRCNNHLNLMDSDEDGVMEIWRDGCGGDGRTLTAWTGTEFAINSK